MLGQRKLGLGKARGLLSYFTRHGTAANLMLVIMLVLGLAALPRMRTQFFPDVIINNVTVRVAWVGAGAEDVDDAIIKVLNPVLLAVEGVEDTHAYASEASALLLVDFEPGWDMGRAADEVQAAVDTVTTLPEDAEDPVIRRGAWRDRVTDVVITGPVGVEQLGRYADEMVTRLFAEGITRATIRGIAAAETLVEVTSKSLIENNIGMVEISKAIAEEAVADPAGDVTGANVRVRTGIAKRSPKEVAAIVLRSNPDGSALTIGDVATVIDEGVTRDRAYFVGDNPAVSIRIDRSERGDAIKIQHKVEAIAEKMLLTLPPQVRIDLIRTRAKAISDRLGILIDNGLMGLILVVSLLFLFLNARTAFWVAAGIPAAMLAAIAMMYMAGLTINMVSLFALIITLGIVVDDAIVVGEHADYRVRQLGEAPIVAAENAAFRMAAPVFSATLTTVIAFSSLALLEGRLGDMASAIPIAVSVVLIASLLECFLILPHHMSRALKHSAKEHWYDFPSRVVNRGLDWFRETLFRPLMRLVIWGRYPVLAGLLLILTIQVAHFIRGDIARRFFVPPEQSSISANFVMIDGASRQDTLAMMHELQRSVEKVGKEYEAEYGTNPVTYLLGEVGGNTGSGISGTKTKAAELLGSVAIELIEVDERPYSSHQLVADLQDAVNQHPKTEILSFRRWRSGPSADSLAVDFYGADASTLKAAAEALKTAVSGYGEVTGLEDSLSYDKPELILELTPQGQALGFSIDSLGFVLRARLSGIKAATYPDGQREASIRVELDKSELSADFLGQMQLRTRAGKYVPLTDIVTVQTRTGFSTIFRENGVQKISVTGDISEDDPTRAEKIIAEIERDILPKIASQFDVAFEMAGLAKQEREFMSDAAVGFGLCLIGIFLALAWIFSSWTRPIVVMAIIPFGIVGTFYGHMAWDVPLSMFTVIGLIGMTGIIINDSIVLITTIDEYATTRGLVPAIIDGTVDRLRPVLLTTLTTVLGLMPLLYEQSSQAQFLKPTVVTLVYGLAFGMVLVLLLVPALMAIQQDFKRQFVALRRAVTGLRRGALVSVATVGAGLAISGLFAVTMGAVVLQDDLPETLRNALPAGALKSSPVVVSFALFVVGSAIFALMTYLIAVLTFKYAKKT